MSSLAKIAPLVLALSLAGGVVFAKDKKDDDAELTVPVPVGGTAQGITVPVFGAEGVKQMEFHMATATRPDEGHLQMTDLRLETFTSAGASDMLVDMPVSVLDLKTRIISSDRPVMIRRSDFEIVGETMEFDSSARAARINGKTRMLIFDSSSFSTGKSDHE